MVFSNMRKFNIYNDTSDSLKMEIKFLKRALNISINGEKIKNIYFNVIITDSVKDLNKKYRGIDSETDVISFALEDDKTVVSKGKRVLGDIYISLTRAKEDADEYNISLIEEIVFLGIHGFLHLSGYDHIEEKDKIKMFERQERYLYEIRKRF